MIHIVRLEFSQFEGRVWFVGKKKPLAMPGTWISEQDKPGCDQGIKVKVNFKKDNKGWDLGKNYILL